MHDITQTNVKVLGIDPSLRAYGYAIYDSSATGVMRRIDSGHEETLPVTVPVARFMHFRALVQNLIRLHNPDLIGMESPAYGAGPFNTIHFGLVLYTEESAFLARKDFVLFDPATLKSLVRGTKSKRGVISKTDMQNFVKKDTLDTRVIDHNEADAYAIAYFSERMMSLISGDIDPDDLSETERSIFITKTRKKKVGKTFLLKPTAHVFRENSRFFRFSSIPPGSVSLPSKAQIPQNLLEFLKSQETTT